MLTETESGTRHVDWYQGKTKISTWEGPEGNGAVQSLKGI